jgi:peptide/nickel transport system permease protein
MYSVLVLFGVSILVFSMVHLLPGDPVTAILGADDGAAMADREAMREQLGLNDPLYVQYWNFLSNALRGDLGYSLSSGQPVSRIIVDQLPATLRLTLAAMGVAVVVGAVLGTVAALFHNRFPDFFSMIFALIGVSMPNFWLGLLLIFFFSFNLGWLPSTGATSWKTLILPAITLGTSASAMIARLTRSALLEVMRQEYIKAARAKGLSNASVLLRHAAKNAAIPVITVMGLQMGNLLGGSVVVETVFSRPGLGRVAVSAISSRDINIVQGVVLFAAVMYVLMNLVVDLLYAFLDPRIRYE